MTDAVRVIVGASCFIATLFALFASMGGSSNFDGLMAALERRRKEKLEHLERIEKMRLDHAAELERMRLAPFNIPDRDEVTRG